MKGKKKIIFVSMIVIAFISTIVLLIVFNGKSKTSSFESESDLEKTSVVVNEISNNASSGEILQISDNGTGIIPDESKIENKKEKTAGKARIATAEPLLTSDIGNASKSDNKGNYVKDADPETGISWDGESHIIYTYSDGTKGSEKEDGALYEVSPGVTRVYYASDESEWDGNCSVCGKKSGDGKNGTCVRWLMSDIDCPACKEHVKQGECHTCKE